LAAADEKIAELRLLKQKGENMADEARMELVMLRQLVEDNERRLDMAAIQFQGYAEHHAQKGGDPVKASRNRDMAAMCEGRAAIGLPERPKRLTVPLQRVQSVNQGSPEKPPAPPAVQTQAAPAKPVVPAAPVVSPAAPNFRITGDAFNWGSKL
ncbi:MAG TPA: hypothetical protein VM450_19795, partial [Thermomicrobiales bacterium]|nr:hypothetical protein [Thermomicrobiales bacterium]